MTSRWFRCKTCDQAISADAPAVSCPSCGDDTRRVDVSQISSKKDRCIFLSPGTTGERRAMSSIVEEIGRDAEWIRAATLAVGDGRVSPSEARGLLLSMRRHFAASRPLVEALADLAGDTRPALPVDLDDLDHVGDADRIPLVDYHPPVRKDEQLEGRAVCAAILVGLVGALAVIGASAWIWRDTLHGWGW